MAAVDNRNFEEVRGTAENVGESSNELFESTYNPQEQKDKTRSEIALYFVKAYITLVIFLFVIVFAYNLILISINKDGLILEIKDIFPLVIGTVGTLLGFVLGYYFKSEEKN
jgi:hypothetical protein